MNSSPDFVPEIAVIGHPNEGKSSVLSTLAEDDSVRISSFPGETTVCRGYPVRIDGREVLRFTDTPGFQHPSRLLSLLSRGEGLSEQRLHDLLAQVGADPELREDYELLQPVARGAGLIFVADGSRPLRSVDTMEMEVLRLLNRPRMAVLNCKDKNTRHLESWRDELNKHFNLVRLFNAHQASYRERIELLRALGAIDQGWQGVISEVVRAFETDWAMRLQQVATHIIEMLRTALTHSITISWKPPASEESVKNKLFTRFTTDIGDLERETQKKIRALFKHNIFNYRLPPHSILREELFSARTWQLLGLDRRQLATVGGLGGAAAGAVFDVAALGHSLGAFTALGGAIGGISGWLTPERLPRAALLGMEISATKMQMGPVRDISLLFVLLNRALLFTRHTSNWAHGRRDYPATEDASPQTFDNTATASFSASQLRICRDFFTALQKDNPGKLHTTEQALHNLMVTELSAITMESGGTTG